MISREKKRSEYSHTCGNYILAQGQKMARRKKREMAGVQGEGGGRVFLVFSMYLGLSG